MAQDRLLRWFPAIKRDSAKQCSAGMWMPPFALRLCQTNIDQWLLCDWVGLVCACVTPVVIYAWVTENANKNDNMAKHWTISDADCSSQLKLCQRRRNLTCLLIVVVAIVVGSWCSGESVIMWLVAFDENICKMSLMNKGVFKFKARLLFYTNTNISQKW